MRNSFAETSKYRNRIQKRMFEIFETLKNTEINDQKHEGLRWLNAKLDRIIAEFLLQKEFFNGSLKIMNERDLTAS